MYKELSGTQFKLDFSIGQVVQHKIVHHRRKQIEVDLVPIYEIVGDRTEEEVDLALMEFFTTAVVGQLIKTNHQLIQINPNRRKVFMGVIRRLHDLFALARECDKQANQIAKYEAELGKLIEQLGSQTRVVKIGGALFPIVELEFTMPDVDLEKEGEVSIGQRTASLTFRRNAGSGEVDVFRVDADGQESSLTLSREELTGVSILERDGLIDWDRIHAPKQEDPA